MNFSIFFTSSLSQVRLLKKIMRETNCTISSKQCNFEGMRRVKEGGSIGCWWAVIRYNGVGVGRLRIISSGHEQMDDDVMWHLVGRGTC